MIRLGDHVVVRGEDEEAVVTAVHPDSQIEVEFLKASEGGSRRKRYASEALEVVGRDHDHGRDRDHDHDHGHGEAN